MWNIWKQQFLCQNDDWVALFYQKGDFFIYTEIMSTFNMSSENQT